MLWKYARSPGRGRSSRSQGQSLTAHATPRPTPPLPPPPPPNPPQPPPIHTMTLARALAAKACEQGWERPGNGRARLSFAEQDLKITREVKSVRSPGIFDVRRRLHMATLLLSGLLVPSTRQLPWTQPIAAAASANVRLCVSVRLRNAAKCCEASESAAV